MKLFDPKNWNKGAYHFYYRNGNGFKEMCPITILDVTSDTIYYTINTDQYTVSKAPPLSSGGNVYFEELALVLEHDNWQDDPLNWNIPNYKNAEISFIYSQSNKDEFFELAIEELMHYI